MGVAGVLFFSTSINFSEIVVKAAHNHNIISEAQSCVITTQAGFDYGGIDWSDINWFDNTSLKCNTAKKWHNIISYGWCCGYTLTWNDIIPG